MQYTIHSEVLEVVRSRFDSTLELAGWFLAQNGLVMQTDLTVGEENNISPLSVRIPSDFIEMVKANPLEYKIMMGHMHSVPYGKKIREFDPYWTVRPESETPSLNPGDIIDNRFFVSRKPAAERRKGDSGSFQAICEYGEVIRIDLSQTLFIHPAYGSEDATMQPSGIEITIYQFDPASRFLVRELQTIKPFRK